MDYRSYMITGLDLSRVEELHEFMKQTGFLWSNKPLLEYILGLSENIHENILVLFNNKIVGCNLFIDSKVLIKQHVRYIKWSHSTFLMPEHRKYIGIKFLAESLSRGDVWGFGLTKANEKIHRLNGSVFCSPSLAYIYECKNNAERELVSKTSVFPDEFICENREFKRCYLASDHNMVNNGFWNSDMLDVDIVRDCDFMKKRFYDSGYKYWIYRVEEFGSCDELYLVIKEISQNTKNILYLVDYRFRLNRPDSFYAILNALKYLAKLNKYDCIFISKTFNSDIKPETLSYKPYGYPSSIVTNCPEAYNNMEIMVTPADSDCELIPFDYD